MEDYILNLNLCNLNEGIDVRLSPYRNVREVTLTDQHENGVDMSISNNPTKKIYTMDDGNKVTIYSIFQRNTGVKTLDGNPLLYALKKEKGFAFASPYVEKQFWVRFETILDKFISQFNNDIVVINPINPRIKGTNGILIPSSKPINKRIADILSIHSGITIIDNILRKKTWWEIFQTCNEKTSYFYKYWHNKRKYNYMINYLYDTYVTDDDDIFRIHDISKNDMELRKTITNTLTTANIKDYYNIINGKDILIIDDSITMCQTFKSAYNVLINNYTPKTITGLTMFSEKVK